MNLLIRALENMHYIKDHIGNVCAVVNSAVDTTIQSTIYYPSGVPMAKSLGRNVSTSQYNAMGIQETMNLGLDEQPYLYNGKEYITAHDLNEYDSQARRYYATIMRATTIDPMAESNYHISPYAWCGNNPIRHIDEDGQYYYDFWTGTYRSTYTHEEVDWATIQANNYIEPKPQKIIGARYLTFEWAIGKGGSTRTFSEEDNLTQQFINDNPRLEGIYKEIADAIEEGIMSSDADPETKEGKYNFKLKEQEHKFRIFLHDGLNIISNGKTGNVAMSIVGSFSIRWKVVNPDDHNGNAVVEITASNPMRVRSGIRMPSDAGYGAFYTQKVAPIIDRVFNNGLGNTRCFAEQTQTFTWTAKIPKNK